MTLLDSVNLDSYPIQASVCPTCGTDVDQRFYGPCSRCRTEMRVRQTGEARAVEVSEYVPKMNVTPNAVALKDD